MMVRRRIINVGRQSLTSWQTILSLPELVLVPELVLALEIVPEETNQHQYEHKYHVLVVFIS